MWHQHQLRVWILKIGVEVGIATVNWLLVKVKPGRLLAHMISIIVCSSPFRVALYLKTTCLAVLVCIAPDTDGQSSFVLGEALVHQCGFQLYYF